MAKKGDDPIKEEKRAIDEEKYSEPRGLKKTYGKDLGMIDEQIVPSTRIEKGADVDLETDDNFGFHIEE